MASPLDPLRLLDSRNRGAILRGIRADVSSFDPPEIPDPELTEVIDRPFESLPDTEARFSRLNERLRDRADRRSVFLSIYTRMTREVRLGIEEGTFEDPAWMQSYVLAFADYYRRAFLSFERGALDDVPYPWRVAFGTSIRGDTLIIQDAFLGINAHINYDLALALDDVGIDHERTAKYRDHRAINDVLADLVDDQQTLLAEVYAPGVEDIDAIFGRFDEAFTLLSMTEGREQAWRVATVLAEFDGSLVRSYARWVLRTTALGVAAMIRAPGLDPQVLDALKDIEQEGVEHGQLFGRLAGNVPGG
jgi:hypothetical protein